MKVFMSMASMSFNGAVAQDVFLAKDDKLAESDSQWLPVCPAGSSRIGTGDNADIQGCGLSDCTAYQGKTIGECQKTCTANSACKSFSFAPSGGDPNFPGTSVCLLYDSTTPTRQWTEPGVKQIMCSRRSEPSPNALLFCPAGSSRIGTGDNADIQGCGLSDCTAYQGRTIGECQKTCTANSACKSFSFAPSGGDPNFPGTSVCLLYDSTTPTRQWTEPGVKQIMCSRRSEAVSYVKGTISMAKMGSTYSTEAQVQDACSGDSDCKGYCLYVGEWNTLIPGGMTWRVPGPDGAVDLVKRKVR